MSGCHEPIPVHMDLSRMEKECECCFHEWLRKLKESYTDLLQDSQTTPESKL